jgi:pimeloyl-ACP methyl ester carboxylesterase
MRQPLEPAEAMKRVMADGAPDLNPFRRIDELETTTPPLLSPEELSVFVRAFERTGFRGGINWYRNFDYNWDSTAYLSGARVQQPALMITADLDPVLRPELAAGMEAWVPNLRATHLVKNCGHWTQQEKPEEVNRLLIDFLSDLTV